MSRGMTFNLVNVLLYNTWIRKRLLGPHFTAWGIYYVGKNNIDYKQYTKESNYSILNSVCLKEHRSRKPLPRCVVAISFVMLLFIFWVNQKLCLDTN